MTSMPQVCLGDLGDIQPARASQRAKVDEALLATRGLNMTTPGYRAPEARGLQNDWGGVLSASSSR